MTVDPESCPMWPKADFSIKFAGIEAETRAKECPTMQRGTLPIASEVFRDILARQQPTHSLFPNGAKPLSRHEATASAAK